MRYCRAQLADGDGVAREICVAVVRALPHYDRQSRPFLSFVLDIARRHVDRHLRADLRGRVTKLFRTLPPRQREVLVLRVIVGLSAPETADALGTTPAAVRIAQHRAVHHLRKVLDARGGPGTAA